VCVGGGESHKPHPLHGKEGSGKDVFSSPSLCEGCSLQDMEGMGFRMARTGVHKSLSLL